jgi:Sulfotransferase family
VTGVPRVGPPTFLVGSERSGTTLLRLMLDSHPELAFHAEFEWVVQLMSDEQGWPDLDAFYELMRLDRSSDHFSVDRSLDYPSLVRSLLEQKRVADDKPRIGATVHLHFDRLLRIWPDARFLHLVRDGRDVARSCVQRGWYGEVSTAAERWLTAEALWDRVAKTLPPERCLEVKYEDLAADPVPVLTRICEWIGIPYHPAMLEYPTRSSYAYPRADFAYQWKGKLTPHQVQLLEARIGDVLVSRGYELSGLPRIEPTRIEQTLLRLQNRVGVARARLRSLGPRLWLASLVSTRLGSKAWRTAVLLRINDVVSSQLD